MSEKLSKDIKDLPQPIRDSIVQNTSGVSIVRTVHQRFDSDNSAVGKVEFDLKTEESAGTQQFFALGGPFLHTLREGSVLVVDELDARLHPLLTKQLVGLFNSSANQKNAQLIFATHDQGLLDQKQIRRDQIWFIEKDEMGASSLFSLNFPVACPAERQFACAVRRLRHYCHSTHVVALIGRGVA